MSSGPRYHLAPERGWVNDPNGMTRRDGRWHVFFQHNPAGPFHDRIAWGHASSPDLVTWRAHPTAFAPTPGAPDEGGCWSGVFVPGLDRPAMVYTGIVDGPTDSTVCLRWGSDDLDTWGPPVVVAATPDGIREMRDPFVFRWGGRRWALVGAGLDDGTPAVLLFGCDDVLRWDFRGVWLSLGDAALAAASDADVWECPQLVVGGQEAAVILSLNRGGVPGSVVVAVGRLTGEADDAPRFSVEGVHPLDTGTHLFAPQVLADDGTGEGPLMFGWVRDEDPGRAHALPDDALVGCLTLPRRVAVTRGRMTTRLDPAVGRLLGPPAPLGEGEHAIDPTSCVEVARPAAGLVLEPAGLDLGDVPPGTQVWVDGPVVEVYRGDAGPTVTLRHPDASWSLRVPASAQVSVRAVTPPARG